MSCEWDCYQSDDNHNTKNNKYNGSKSAMPCFMHSTTQIGKDIVVYGGSDYFGEAIPQLLVLDTTTMRWSLPTEEVGIER